MPNIYLGMQLTTHVSAFVDRCNEYQAKGSDTWRLGSKGRYSLCVGGR